VRSQTVEFLILGGVKNSWILSRGSPWKRGSPEGLKARQPRGLPHDWLSTYSVENNYFWPHPVNKKNAPFALYKGDAADAALLCKKRSM